MLVLVSFECNICTNKPWVHNRQYLYNWGVCAKLHHIISVHVYNDITVGYWSHYHYTDVYNNCLPFVTQNQMDCKPINGISSIDASVYECMAMDTETNLWSYKIWVYSHNPVLPFSSVCTMVSSLPNITCFNISLAKAGTSHQLEKVKEYFHHWNLSRW